MASRNPVKIPIIANKAGVSIRAPIADTDPIFKPGVDIVSEESKSKLTRASMMSHGMNKKITGYTQKTNKDGLKFGK